MISYPTLNKTTTHERTYLRSGDRRPNRVDNESTEDERDTEHNMIEAYVCDGYLTLRYKNVC